MASWTWHSYYPRHWCPPGYYARSDRFYIPGFKVVSLFILACRCELGQTYRPFRSSSALKAWFRGLNISLAQMARTTKAVSSEVIKQLINFGKLSLSSLAGNMKQTYFLFVLAGRRVGWRAVMTCDRCLPSISHFGGLLLYAPRTCTLKHPEHRLWYSIIVSALEE